MMKNKILFGLMFGIVFGMILMGGVSAANVNYTCYQETANVSTACGGLSTGKYYIAGTWEGDQAILYDGNWQSSAGTLSNGSLFINYTKPGATRGVRWTIGVDYIIGGPHDGPSTIGYNLPISCYNLSIIHLLINASADNPSDYNMHYCWGGSTLRWIYLGEYDWNYVFEESITWTIETPNVTLYYPLGLFGYILPGTNTSLNYSITGDNISACKYYYNVTNRTLNCSLNSTITLYAQKNLTFYANNTEGGQYNKTYSWDYNIFEHTRSYANLTTAGSIETFTINITYPTTIYSGITAKLVYNQTEHIMSTADTGGTQKYAVSIPIAWTDTTFNNTFYFSFTLQNSTDTVVLNSSTYNQTVTTFLIDNCSAYTKKIMTFSMQDEETLGSLNGTVKITAYFYDADRVLLFNTFNATLRVNSSNVNTSSVCLANITGSYSMDYVAQFYNGSVGMALGTTAGGYYIKYKMIQNYTLNNQTIEQNISLYDLLYTSGYIFNVIVRGVSGGNANILVDAQKQYLPTADFKSIESYVTDNSGEGIVHLIPATGVYNFLVSKNGHLLGTFNNYQVKCDNYATGDCQIRLSLSAASSVSPDYSKFGNIQGAFLVDQAIRTLFFTWATTDGQAHTVEQNVVLFDGFGNETICNNSATGTSGTFTCLVPVLYGNTTFMARTYVYSFKTYIGTFLFGLGDGLTDWQGVDVIIELLMYCSLVLLSLSAPAWVVIGGMIGLVMAMFLIFFNSSTPAIISVVVYFIAAGVVILTNFNNRGH